VGGLLDLATRTIQDLARQAKERFEAFREKRQAAEIEAKAQAVDAIKARAGDTFAQFEQGQEKKAKALEQEQKKQAREKQRSLTREQGRDRGRGFSR